MLDRPPGGWRTRTGVDGTGDNEPDDEAESEESTLNRRFLVASIDWRREPFGVPRTGVDGHGLEAGVSPLPLNDPLGVCIPFPLARADAVKIDMIPFELSPGPTCRLGDGFGV